jgi:EAL domain
MAVDESDRAIARSVLALGRDLGLVTVAEGVESREGWDLLTMLGCDLAQGFVVCPPLTAHQFGEWLGRRPPNEFAYLDDRYADEIAAYRAQMSGGDGRTAEGVGPEGGGADPAGTGFVAIEIPAGNGSARVDDAAANESAAVEDAGASGSESAAVEDAAEPAGGNGSTTVDLATAPARDGAVVDVSGEGSAVGDLAGAPEPERQPAGDQTSGQG